MIFHFIGSWFLFGKLYQGREGHWADGSGVYTDLVETNERAMREMRKGVGVGKKEYSTGFRPDSIDGNAVLSLGGGSLCILGVKIDGLFFFPFPFLFFLFFLFFFFPFFFSVYAFFLLGLAFFSSLLFLLVLLSVFLECLTIISLHFQLYIKIQAMKRFVLKKVFVPKKNL